MPLADYSVSLAFPNSAVSTLPVPAVNSPASRSDVGTRRLRPQEIARLEQQGCFAEDWNRVLVAQNCDLGRLRFVTFLGEVSLGRFQGSREIQPGGLRHPTGIYHATLQDCTVGHDVLIRNVRQGLARYDIEDEVTICDVGRMSVDLATSFGNGQEVAVLREDGRCSVTIHDQLSSHLASLATTTPQDGVIPRELRRLADEYAERVRSDRGRVGRGAVIAGCNSLAQVQIGPAARLLGAAALTNVSINSTANQPVEIGHLVSIQDSIISAGSRVDGGAILERCFIGQNVRIDKQFAAVDCLFFSNSQAELGEAQSLLAGPHTTTRHKSTRLAATQTSFFQASAGTAAGSEEGASSPVHYGMFERGCKTGSASHIAWPANVGPFTTVLGKHSAGFDTRDFPFSLVIEQDGASRLIPAVNLLRVGLSSDEQAWAAAEQHGDSEQLDFLHHEVLSPWSVQRMIRARYLLEQLDLSDADRDGWFEHAGVRIHRRDVQRGFDLYHRAIHRYLAQCLVEQLEAAAELPSGVRSNGEATEATEATTWRDIGGCFVTSQRLASWLADLAAGRIQNVDELRQAWQSHWKSFDADRWTWAWQTWLSELRKSAGEFQGDDWAHVVREWARHAKYFVHGQLDDARDDWALAQTWDANRRSAAWSLTGEQPSSDDRSPQATAMLAELARIEQRSTALLNRLSYRTPVAGR